MLNRIHPSIAHVELRRQAASSARGPCSTSTACSRAPRGTRGSGGASPPSARSDDAIGRCGQSSSSLLDLPHVLLRQPPVVASEHPQIDDRVRLDAPGEVDVPLEVAQRQRARRGEDRLAPVQSRVARARDRAPARRRAVDEDHVVEQVDRLEAEDQRRIAVLLEDDGRRERRFEAVRGAGADDAAERSQRLAALLGVVRQRVQPAPARRAGVRSRAISRRSAAVNGSAGGSAGSVRGSGSRCEVGNELAPASSRCRCARSRGGRRRR